MRPLPVTSVQVAGSASVTNPDSLQTALGRGASVARSAPQRSNGNRKRSGLSWDVLSLVLCLSVAVPTAPEAHRPLEDCDALYYGEGRTKDYAKALACYRSQGVWEMVAILQLNGEGAPVDVAGARASFRQMQHEGISDGDADALDGILKQRETKPNARPRHLDFCADLAATTPSLGYCARRKENSVAAKDDRRLVELRARIEPAARTAFDAAVAAFRPFVEAEGDRAYQKWIDGTIRGQASIAEESFVRANFMAEIDALAKAGAAGPRPGPRSFADADRQLNIVYRGDIRDDAPMAERADAAAHQASVRDYRAKSRATQHLWVRYRDAMAKLAVARWPQNTEVAMVTQALVTEDRIRELTPSEGDVR
jgi:uncharacterized protein YecT (DUF1311 family)